MERENKIVKRLIAEEVGEIGVIIADTSFLEDHDQAPPEEKDKKTKYDYKIIKCMEKNPNIPIDIMNLENKNRRELVIICSEFCSGFTICQKHEKTRHLVFL